MLSDQAARPLIDFKAFRHYVHFIDMYFIFVNCYDWNYILHAWLVLTGLQIVW